MDETAPVIHAIYFDGQRATAVPVQIALTDARVVVAGDGVDRNEPLEALVVSDRIGSAPIFLRFVDGASCEVADVDGLAAMMSAAGLGRDRLSAWERSRPLAAVAAAVLVIALAAAYFVVLPYMARVAADRVPRTGLNAISTHALSVLDAGVFEPSRLPPERTELLRDRFAAMRWPSEARIPVYLSFRHSPALGANALALPSGYIIVTDQLVELAANDLELIAVIAHEVGHVQARHGLRSIIQSSVVSIFVTWYVGDVTGLAAAAPTAILEARYSRDLELEADIFAVQALRRNDLPVGFFVDILRAFDRRQSATSRNLASATAYLSTHPGTAERIAFLRQFDSPD